MLCIKESRLIFGIILLVASEDHPEAAGLAKDKSPLPTSETYPVLAHQDNTFRLR